MHYNNNHPDMPPPDQTGKDILHIEQPFKCGTANQG